MGVRQHRPSNTRAGRPPRLRTHAAAGIASIASACARCWFVASSSVRTRRASAGRGARCEQAPGQPSVMAIAATMIQPSHATRKSKTQQMSRGLREMLSMSGTSVSLSPCLLASGGQGGAGSGAGPGARDGHPDTVMPSSTLHAYPPHWTRDRPRARPLGPQHAAGPAAASRRARTPPPPHAPRWTHPRVAHSPAAPSPSAMPPAPPRLPGLRLPAGPSRLSAVDRIVRGRIFVIVQY